MLIVFGRQISGNIKFILDFLVDILYTLFEVIKCLMKNLKYGYPFF